MAFSHTIGGTTFTEASFQGNAYADEATGFPKALEKMIEHVANAYRGTSSDPLTVGAGAKALTVSNGSGQIPAFSLGMPVRIARTSDPAGVWMQGEITVWDGATGIATINVDATKGSGSFADWSIVIGGHLTTASGAPPLAVSQGGTGASSSKAALANLLPSVAGVMETNASFVDAVIFGPALDSVKSWDALTAAPTATLMLATVEDAGADTEINIWDLTAANLTGPAPLATVTLSGAAMPTSIAAAMGHIIVGHEDGITIIDPHDGAWQERTTGWPRSLSTSTTPALSNNNVVDVGAGFSDQPAHDPRTGGPMPTFAVAYGTGTVAASVMKDDGNLYSPTGGSNPGTHTGFFQGHFLHNQAPKEVRASKISTMTADFSYADGENFLRSYDGTAGAYNPSDVVAMDVAEDGRFAVATASYAMLGINTAVETSLDVLHARITRSINTGLMLTGTKGAWLANHKTDDNSYENNDLTENGTVTEAAVETGAELNGYTFSSTSNYFNHAHNSDFEFSSGGMSMHCWIKSTSGQPSLEQSPMGWGDPAHLINVWYNFTMTSNGYLQFYYYSTGGATGVSVQSTQDFADDEWHLMSACFDTDQGEVRMYVDGVLQDTQTHGASGGFVNASGQFFIGMERRSLYPCDQCEISLARVSRQVPSQTEIREMYEAEKPMFAANAKCLLQSGTTDAVLDVSVDPITGKAAVVQTDSAMIFNGLVVESEPAIATGGTNFEHLLSYGDDQVQINDANLYAIISAKDLREDLEILRGLKVGLPEGIDLSKAKVLLYQSSNGGVNIASSMNVKSVTSLGTGRYWIEFGIPFKSANDIVPCITGCSYADGFENNGLREAYGIEVVTEHHEGTNYNSAFALAIFGELENE